MIQQFFFIISYMRSMKARVAERGQVTIPKRLRERLGLKPGTILEFKSAVYGCLSKKIDTDVLIAELRGRG